MPRLNWACSRARERRPSRAAIERTVLRRFDVVSSISDRMMRRAFDKGVEGARLFSLPNWVDTQQIFPLGRASEYRRLLGIADTATVVLYSGNMGAKQGIEILAWAAAKLSSHTDIVFVFCGNGASKADLQTRCTTLENCRFLSLQPAERLNELLNLADIHVLPQRNDAADLVMPSKLTGMLASGRAIIAMARVGTELSNVVAPRGVVVPPEDVKALVAAIEVAGGRPAAPCDARGGRAPLCAGRSCRPRRCSGGWKRKPFRVLARRIGAGEASALAERGDARA